ncbi:MAG TPA: sugar phosphate isomerase/epimerase [Bryobacteraceae bacterium]|nr:sugar phosphate isomerase/epimerase [Bryobacteraceae bacterium]
MITGIALHSVSYAGRWGQHALTLDQCIDKASELGFDGLMLMAKRPHLSVLDYPPQNCRDLRRRLEHARVRAVCIAGYNNFTADLEHGDVPQIEIQVAHITDLARMAHELACPLVRVFTAFEHPARAWDAQYELVIGALRQCGRAAAPLGVTIGVQNHHDIAVDAGSLCELITEIAEPNCRAIYDAWAPAVQGLDPVPAARRMGAITVHTTMANYQPRARWIYEPAVVNYRSATPRQLAVPIDEGSIEFRPFLRALADAGFRGTVAYEMCSRLRDGGTLDVLDSYARRFLRFMEELRRAEPALWPAAQAAS